MHFPIIHSSSSIQSAAIAALLFASEINGLPHKVTYTLSSNPCLVCQHLIRHALAFGVSTSEKLCRSLDDKQLQSKCYDYIEVASKMGKEAPKYCSRPQICPSESTERIEVSESETIIRKTKTGGATDEYYRRSLTLDNGKVALESVAVNTESSRSSPQTGRRQITRSTHSADDVLEVRDDKPHESHRAGHCVDNDCDDNDDYDDDDDDDKIARPSLTLRWAQFIVFYGSLYLPWICIALLILGVFIELYDISGYFDDDYKNLPADATTDKVGYYCIVRETDDAAAKSSKKNSI